MELVKYKFTCLDENGKRISFVLPVNVTKETDEDSMRDICELYMKVSNIKGTPVGAIPVELSSTDRYKRQSYLFSSNKTIVEEHKEEEKMVWARVCDEQEARTAWIPAIKRGNRIFSAIGELFDPESTEDTREFDDCPIPGYRVVKIDDSKEIVPENKNQDNTLFKEIKVCYIYSL